MAKQSPRGPLLSASVYSDLGFIVLGDLIENRLGARLDQLFQPIAEALAIEVEFRPLDKTGPEDSTPPAARCAPTRRESPARELLRGQVHDDNARAMLGVAPHAGLFGTAAGVHRFAAALVDTYHDAGTPAQRALGIRSATVRRFFATCVQSGLLTTWGLGWDRPDPLPAGHGVGLRPRRQAGCGRAAGSGIWATPAARCGWIWRRALSWCCCQTASAWPPQPRLRRPRRG